MPKGIVAIVGRPNVGKSTFFNRLIEERRAIVEDQPGVTRDRIYGVCEWGGEQFTVVDTGGYVQETDDIFAQAIREQVEIALAEADVVVFMLDAQAGLVPADADVANFLRKKAPKNLIVVANKVDNPVLEANLADFYSLGFTNIFPVSSLSGSGDGEILDEIVSQIRALPEHEPEADIPRIAIVGRPNVGKSSFVNALLGKNSNIVTPIAGTTRDSILSRFSSFGFDCYLVDTAGLRKKTKVDDNVEFFSNLRTLRAIETCDVAILMLDASQGLEAQDLKILHQIEKHKKGLVICINKWDLVKKEKHTDREFIDQVQERIAPLSNIPIIFTSATERKHLLKVLEKANEVFQVRDKRISTSELLEYILPIIENTPPPTHRGKPVRIKFATQVEGRNPTFIFFANHPKYVKESYARFLENRIRERWPFAGWPVNIYFRQK